MQIEAHAKLRRGLQEDLTRELTAIHYYLYCAAVIPGLPRLLLRPFFLQEAQEETSHAQYLAEKIDLLGGEPDFSTGPIAPTRDVQVMLHTVWQYEQDAIDGYHERIAQAKEAKDMELQLQLEEFLAEETRHRDAIARLRNGGPSSCDNPSKSKKS